MTVTLGVASIFMLAITGFLQSSLGLAAKHRARTDQRSGSRFAADYLLSELAAAGGRVPVALAFGVDTLNNVADPLRADPGTDTLAVVHSVKGLRTTIRNRTGNFAAGSMLLAFHTDDDTGPDAICPSSQQCVEAFLDDHGGPGDLLLVSAGEEYWVVRMTSPPAAVVGGGGGILITYVGVLDNTGGTDFSVGDQVTGIVARNFRVMDGNLEMQEDFYDPNGEFAILAAGVEDLQLGFILADGTYVNSGLPAPIATIEATSVSLVTVQPPDLNARGDSFHRPALEDNPAGTEMSSRRRTILRSVIWGRNLAGP